MAVRVPVRILRSFCSPVGQVRYSKVLSKKTHQAAHKTPEIAHPATKPVIVDPRKIPRYDLSCLVDHVAGSSRKTGSIFS